MKQDAGDERGEHEMRELRRSRSREQALRQRLGDGGVAQRTAYVVEIPADRSGDRFHGV